MKHLLFATLLIQSLNANAVHPDDALVSLFLVPNKERHEQCQTIPALANVNYGKSSKKKEKKLCEMDFYGLTAGTKTLAVCPKLNSSNPGTNLYEIPDGYTKSEIERMNCESSRVDIDKEAKFKSSTSCSYYPSIIGYYHFSRVLKVGDVPESVFRTMNTREHYKVTNRAMSILRNRKKTSSLIYKTWTRFYNAEVNALRGRSLSKDEQLIFSSDANQVLGGLSDNPKGEKFYTEIMPSGGYDSRHRNFFSRDAGKTGFSDLTSSSSMRSQLSERSWGSAITKLQKLKDVSGMIVIDHIMSQQDRMGNFEKVTYYFYQLPDGEIKKVKKKKYDHFPAEKKLVDEDDATKVINYERVVEAPVLMLKDNDCGIKKTLKITLDKVAAIRHLNYGLYQRVQFLSSYLNSSAGIKYLKDNLKIKESGGWYAKKLAQRAENVADVLKKNCQSGSLQFDLSFSQYVDGARYKHSNFSCDFDREATDLKFED